MGVSYAVVSHLRNAGHDALHLRDIGQQRMSDADVFALAWRESRVILTFDLDFAALVAAAGTRLPSVILFRLNDARAIRVIARLEQALQAAAAALDAGAVVSVDDAAFGSASCRSPEAPGAHAQPSSVTASPSFQARPTASPGRRGARVPACVSRASRLRPSVVLKR